MAVSSSTTAAALHYISKPQQNYAPRTTTTGSSSSSSCSFSVSITSSLSKTTKKPLKVTVRSSSDGSASAETTVTQAEAESESPIELPKGPPSVISTLNVERALRGIPITDIDYYGSLGIQKGCSNDQVYAAYKNKVEELMNKGFDEEELSKKLEVLKESYAVLSNAQERRLYDWSLARKAALIGSGKTVIDGYCILHMLMASRDKCSKQNRVVIGSYHQTVPFFCVLEACGFASTTLRQLGVSTTDHGAIP
ncbi:hypothetical protein RHMOL_Rhmol10G0229500 [Rhododendron molle]|uniref:Uncharacterized protein n=1 Tax=Rhododendron molle TaxID=49168 RepID=A0ACC0M503_RHOML|nr:hypothetical protein RHMOL_Rhmol10G0229500 [Rhododendron molle]